MELLQGQPCYKRLQQRPAEKEVTHQVGEGDLQLSTVPPMHITIVSLPASR